MRFLCFLLVLCASSAQAKLTVNSIFADHMVLQQQMSVPIWGTASPNQEIKVEFANQSLQTKSSADGSWKVNLQPLVHNSEGQTLSISGDGNQIDLKDVVVGEVWIGSGQSNMAYSMSETTDGKEEIPKATYPLIRIHTRLANTRMRPTWHLVSPETVKDFSAVAYFFGKKIHLDDKVPVGIIVRAVGGTTIQRWVSKEASSQNKLIQSRMQEAAKHSAADFERYEKESSKYDKRNPPDAKTKLWFSEMSKLKFYRGLGYGGLYQRMIKPLQPFAIRGVIWYQGEFNNRGGQAFDYREWQTTLVESWRNDWKQGDFPFLYVQMQVLGNSTTTLLRESQGVATKRCPNCAMVVICDQSVGLHPPYKEIAGTRLALSAKHLIHNNPKLIAGPTLKSAKQDGNQFILEFDHVGEKLILKETAEPGFFICGEDQQFKPAEVKVTETNRLQVWHDQIEKPISVRYGWFNDPRERLSLFDSAGMPASPFRTDEWKDATSFDRLFSDPRANKTKKRTKKTADTSSNSK